MRSSSALRALRSTPGLASAVRSARSPTRGLSDMVDWAAVTPAAVTPKTKATADAMLSSLVCMDDLLRLRPSQQARDQRDQEEDHDDDEQDLGNFRRADSDAGDADGRPADGVDRTRSSTEQQ